MISHWFIWNGKNSFSDFGLWVREMPKMIRAKERYEEIKVPGRAGSLILTEGKNVHESYACEMKVSCKNTINIGRIKGWLRGSGGLILSTDMDRVIPARIMNEVAFERDEKNRLLVGTVPLFCEPYRTSRWMEKDRMTFTENGIIRNPGDLDAKPIVTISGAGDITVGIGGTSMTFYGVDGQIVVDCGAQIVTQDGQIWQGSYTGDFWLIPVGDSTVEVNAATVTIDPHWRWF